MPTGGSGGWFLGELIGGLDAAGTTVLTVDDMVAGATTPADADPYWWALRLSVARGFARVDCRLVDPISGPGARFHGSTIEATCDSYDSRVRPKTMRPVVRLAS